MRNNNLPAALLAAAIAFVVVYVVALIIAAILKSAGVPEAGAVVARFAWALAILAAAAIGFDRYNRNASR